MLQETFRIQTGHSNHTLLFVQANQAISHRVRCITVLGVSLRQLPHRHVLTQACFKFQAIHSAFFQRRLITLHLKLAVLLERPDAGNNLRQLLIAEHQAGIFRLGGEHALGNQALEHRMLDFRRVKYCGIKIGTGHFTHALALLLQRIFKFLLHDFLAVHCRNRFGSA